MFLVAGVVRLNPFVQPIQYIVIPEDTVSGLEYPVVFILEHEQL
jgi:CDP-diacylglycerol pyrophosphatase